MQNMINQKDNLTIKIQNTISHSYLQQFIDFPYMDEERLLLLTELVNLLDLSYEKKEKLIITATIIQMALDTHEAVKNESLTSIAFKKQQLSILAGVYYSGLYYKILSDIDDTSYTRALAIAIKEVNEHKITLYQRAQKSTDQLFNDLICIESALIDKFSQNISPSWVELSRNFLLFNRLVKEKKQFTTTGSSLVFDVLYLVEFKKTTIETIDSTEKEILLNIIECKLEELKKTINDLFKHINTISPIVKEMIVSKMF